MAKKLDFKDFLTVDYAPGMDPLIKKAAKKRKSDETETSGPNEAVEVLDEALNAQQRRTRAMGMKRIAAKIALGRDRAARRFADMPRLQSRAHREARSFVFKRLSKGRSKEDMSFQQRQEIEKRMDTPAMKKRIDQLATKLLKKVRAAEVQRHQNSGQQTKND